MVRTAAGIAIFTGLFAAACAGEFSFTTAQDTLCSPLETPGKKAIVLVFYLHDCPICNAYAPEIERIRSDYEAKGFAFFIVQTDAKLSAADAAKHAREYGLKATVLIDPENRLAKLTGAEMTPQAAVIGAEQKVLYLGRIDDLYAGFGKRRESPTTHDLRAALDAVLAGKHPTMAAGPPIGCYIPGSEDKEKKKP